MESIKDIFIIGNGPSSSHTIGPSFAVDTILKDYKNIKSIKVTLYNSLALTGMNISILLPQELETNLLATFMCG